MAIYRVQGPDGRIHRFEGPDGASPEDITLAAQKQFGDVTKPVSSLTQPTKKGSFVDVLGGLFGVRNMGTAIGQTKATDMAVKTSSQISEQNSKNALLLEKRIRAEKDPAKKAKLKALRQQVGTEPSAEDLATQGQGYVSNRAVAGDAARAATLLGTLGLTPTGSAGSGQLVRGEAAKQFLPQGVKQIVGLGAKTGAGFGTGEAIEKAGSVGEGAKMIGTGTALGGLTAGLVEGAGQLFGKIFKAGGNKLIASQANLPRSMARNLKPVDTAGKLADYGITKLDDYADIGHKITGGSGEITKLTREAVAKAKPVDTTGVLDLAKELSQDPQIPPGTDIKLFEFVKRGLVKAYGGSKGSIATTANPSELFGLIQDLEQKASSITAGKSPFVIRPEDQALQSAYRLIADELKDRLFVQSGADSVLVKEIINRPETIDKLKSIIPKQGWTKFLGDLKNVKSVGELRALAAPFVKGSQIARESSAGESLAIMKAGDTLRGAGKYIRNPLNIAAAPIDAASPWIGKVLRNPPRPLNNQLTRLLVRLGVLGSLDQGQEQ